MRIVSLDLWRYEARRCGSVVLATPVVVVVAAVLLSLPAAGGVRGFLMEWSPGALLPLTAGVAAVGVVSREVMAELQSSFPTPYSVTVRRRLGLLAAAALVAVAVPATALAVPGTTRESGAAPHPSVAGSAWAAAAFSLLLIGVGAYAAAGAAARGGVAGSGGSSAGGGGPAATMVMSVWLAKILIIDRVPVPAAAMGVLFAVAGAWLLVHGSRRTGSEVA